jgi:hypothetical protein
MGLSAQVLHVCVGAETGVVRQVPADVVRVIVDGDLIAVPEPVVDEAVVVRRYAEIESVEPKTISVAAFEPELVSASNSSRVATVFKGVIEVIVGIIAARIMSNPMVVIVYVRNVRVTGDVRLMPSNAGWRRTVGRDVTTAEAVGAAPTEAAAVCAAAWCAASMCAAPATSALSKDGR